ncbi:MAG: glycosyltransferase family 2 protein [Planctomycetota bacterium]
MSIDVVIPLYQGGRWIEETLASVFAQGPRLGQVIVVDDGSTDDGPDRVHALGDRVRLIPSAGKLRTRQTGLLATTTPRVAFLDQDDVWHPRHLELLSQALDREPNAPAAAARVLRFRAGEPARHEIVVGPDEPLAPWDDWPWACPIISPSAVLFDRQALTDAGGWLPDPAPDWQVYLRLGLRAPLVRIASATCAYRLHATSHSSAMQRDGVVYLDKMARGAEASFSERMAAETDAAVRDRLALRIGRFRHFDRFVRALQADDVTSARTSAQALEASLPDDPRGDATTLFELAQYLVCPLGNLTEFDASRRRLLERSATAIAPDLPQLHRAFVVLPRRRRFRWRRVVRYALKGRWGQARSLLAQRRERRAPR